VSWLFADQPAGLCTALAEVDGRLVAACGHVVQTIDLPRHGPCEAAFGVDFMVAGEHRRQGLGARLLDLRLERFDLSLSTGQSSGMAALYRHQQAVDLGAFQLARTRRRPRLAGHPRALALEIVMGLQALRRPRIDGQRRPLNQAEARQLISSFPAADEQWFEWRFQGPVYGDYRGWELTTDRGRSLLVTRLEPDREIIVHLVGELPGAEALALAARTSTRSAQDALICGGSLADQLSGAGFLVRPYGARLIGASRLDSVQRDLASGVVDVFASAADADLLRRPPIETG